MNSMNPAGFILYSPNSVTTKFHINRLVRFYSIYLIIGGNYIETCRPDIVNTIFFDSSVITLIF